MLLRLLFAAFLFSQSAFTQVNTSYLTNDWIAGEGFDQWVISEDSLVTGFNDRTIRWLSVSGNTLFLGDYREEDEYLYEEDNETLREPFVYKPSPDDAKFLICKLTPEEMVLHPLNQAAVKIIDETPFGYAGNVREKLYKPYLKEISQAKGEKRNEVIEKWRSEKQLYVDTLHFFSRESFYEPVQFDSITYSSVKIEADSVKFTDTKLSSTGAFIRNTRSVVRTDEYKGVERNWEVADIDMSYFTPPVITDSGEPAMIDPEERKADSISKLIYDAGNGCYTGIVSREWLNDLNEALSHAGLSKLTYEKSEEDYTKYFYLYSYSATRYRIWYNGTFKDVETSVLYHPVVFLNFREELGGMDYNMEDFRPCGDKSATFPLSFPVK